MTVDHVDKALLNAYLEKLVAHALGEQDKSEGQRERIGTERWAAYREALQLVQRVVMSGRLDSKT